MASYDGAISTLWTYNEAAQGLAQSFAKLPGELQRQVQRSGQKIGDALAEDIARLQSSSPERQVNRLAATTRGEFVGGLPGVVSGGPPYTMGAEYGGQRKVRTHNRMPVYGKAVGVSYSKRTTMQFRPHAGKRGHEFWQGVRDGEDTVLDAYRLVIDDAMKAVGL